MFQLIRERKVLMGETVLLFQLIRECKEVLVGAVMVKCYVQQMVGAVLTYKDKDLIENEFQQYEEDLQQILEVQQMHLLVPCQNLRVLS